MAEIRNFEFLGLYSHIFAPINGEIWHGKADRSRHGGAVLRSAPPCRISRLSGPAGRKTHFWTTE